MKERAFLAGPNPYPVHSFLELRKIMGRPYVVCRPCQRFFPVGGLVIPAGRVERSALGAISHVINQVDVLRLSHFATRW